MSIAVRPPNAPITCEDICSTSILDAMALRDRDPSMEFFRNLPFAKTQIQPEDRSKALCKAIKLLPINLITSCASAALAAIVLGNPIGALGGLVIGFTAFVLSSSCMVLIKAPMNIYIIVSLALFIFAVPVLGAMAVGALGLGTISFGAAAGIQWLSIIPSAIITCIFERCCRKLT